MSENEKLTQSANARMVKELKKYEEEFQLV